MKEVAGNRCCYCGWVNVGEVHMGEKGRMIFIYFWFFFLFFFSEVFIIGVELFWGWVGAVHGPSGVAICLIFRLVIFLPVKKPKRIADMTFPFQVSSLHYFLLVASFNPLDSYNREVM